MCRARIDAHVHEFTTPCVVFHSLAEIRDYIREQVKRTPKGGWTVVAGTFPALLCDMRMPTWEAHDAAPDHAAIYAATCACTVSSCALRTSSVTKDTPDLTGDGERIIRDANDEPTGVLNDATTLGKGIVSGSLLAAPAVSLTITLALGNREHARLFTVSVSQAPVVGCPSECAP